MKKILVVSQVVPQWFIDQIKMAFSESVELICITGSEVSGCEIIPAPHYENKSYKTKIRSWIKFNSFLKHWLKDMDDKIDIIIATSNPPINSITIVKQKKHVPFAFIDWDPYPQGILSYGKTLPLRVVYHVWNKINNKYYPLIDRIITLGPSMEKEVRNSISTKINIESIPISVDTDRIKPIAKENNLFLKNNKLFEKKIILFSGAMGYTKNIELILDTADLMKYNSEICFVMIGSGPKYEIADQIIKKKELNNVHLFPLQSEEMYPFSIACGDIALLPEQIKKESTCVPSRTYSMMAAGEAIVAISHPENDLSKMIVSNQIGEVVSIEDPKELKRVLIELISDEERLSRFKQNARKTAEQYYSLETVTKQYKKVFDGLM